MMSFRAALLLVAALATTAAGADLRVENVRLDLETLDAERGTVVLRFDVGWTESWRDEASWDAAWILARFEREPGVWADLRFTADGHEVDGAIPASVGTVPLPAGHAAGLLVHRTKPGRSAIRLTVRGRWDFRAGFFECPPEGVPVRVHGVELVHVPAGPFDVGEGPVETRRPHSFFAPDDDGRPAAPFRVVSEDAIPVAAGPGSLDYDVGANEAWTGGDRAGPIPEAFPKGTRAFYIMKYAVTQGQYAAFLDALPPRARAARDVTRSAGYADKGGSIVCATDGCTASRPDRAANFLAWADGIAWASWAGLSPMTELEYEKAAAGTDAPAARYADGALPDRVGDSERCSRWGVIDLRGGLWERVVTLGSVEGRSFRGTPGQGFVDDLGQPFAFANPDWPGPRGMGSAYRGGTEGLLDLSAVADRTYGAYEATYGNESQGFRGVLRLPPPS